MRTEMLENRALGLVRTLARLKMRVLTCTCGFHFIFVL